MISGKASDPDQSSHFDYFSEFPGRIITRPEMIAFTAEEIGIWHLLRIHSWQSDNQPYLPDNDEILSKISRISEKKWKKIKTKILTVFEKSENGICDPSLLKFYNSLKNQHNKAREYGKKGARKRWGENSHPITHPNTAPNSNQTVKNCTVKKLSTQDREKLRAEFGDDVDLDWYEQNMLSDDVRAPFKYLLRILQNENGGIRRIAKPREQRFDIPVGYKKANLPGSVCYRASCQMPTVAARSVESEEIIQFCQYCGEYALDMSVTDASK